MTDYQIRIAIAELRGWRNCRYIAELHDCRGLPPAGYKGDRINLGEEAWLPDYLNDLNAMWEARETLTQEQRREFLGWLTQAVLPVYTTQEDYDWFTVHATARQQAEAFVRLHGKWVND